MYQFFNTSFVNVRECDKTCFKMNNSFYKILTLLFLTIIVANGVIAQQPQKKRPIDNIPPVAKTADTTKRDTSKDNLDFIKSTSGLMEEPKISLRNDLPYPQTLEQKVKPLPYQPLSENNVNFRVRVWRDVDGREIINGMFNNDRKNNYGGNRFINILLKAITEDSVTAFSGDDDRFTTPLTPEQAIAAFGGGLDTVPKYDLDGNVVGRQVREKPVYADQIFKFRIKEDWLFDRNTNRLMVRIMGIAPIIPFRSSTGEIAAGSEHVAFWVYYPDIRSILTKYLAYNPRNPGSPFTWEEVFESHRYKSTIVKSDLDNSENKNIDNYVPGQKLQDKEREKITNKILSEERQLWGSN